MFVRVIVFSVAGFCGRLVDGQRKPLDPDYLRKLYASGKAEISVEFHWTAKVIDKVRTMHQWRAF